MSLEAMRMVLKWGRLWTVGYGNTSRGGHLTLLGKNAPCYRTG